MLSRYSSLLENLVFSGALVKLNLDSWGLLLYMLCSWTFDSFWSQFLISVFILKLFSALGASGASGSCGFSEIGSLEGFSGLKVTGGVTTGFLLWSSWSSGSPFLFKYNLSSFFSSFFCLDERVSKILHDEAKIDTDKKSCNH